MSQLTAIRIEEVCPSLRTEFQVRKLRDTRLNDVIVVAISGTYRKGSQGRPDAGYIAGVVHLACRLFNPHKMVVDLSDLEYEWGNNLDLEFQLNGYCPCAIVVGAKCRRGISTLNFGIDTERDIVDNTRFFDDLARAIKHVDEVYERDLRS